MKTTEGTGWIEVTGIGKFNPNFDSLGRSYVYKEEGAGIYIDGHLNSGTAPFSYTPDIPFKVRNKAGNWFEVTISHLGDGRFSIKSDIVT